MAEDDCVLVAERRYQRECVFRERRGIVAAIGCGLGRRVSAHERRDNVVSRRSQRGHLMAKRMGGVGEAVQAEDERAFAHLEHGKVQVRGAHDSAIRL